MEFYYAIRDDRVALYVSRLNPVHYTNKLLNAKWFDYEHDARDQIESHNMIGHKVVRIRVRVSPVEAEEV